MTYRDSADFIAGMKKLQSKAWEDAISMFSKVINQYGYESPELFLKRGLANLGKGFWDEAIDDFKTAIQLGADSAEAFANLARSYRLKGWWDEAIHFWGAALERSENNADYFFRRGLAYFDKGWFNEAIEHFLAAAHINPTEARIPYATAVALACRGQAEEAQRFLKKAVELGGETYKQLYGKFPHAADITKKMMEACGIKVEVKVSKKKAEPKKAAAKKPAAKKAPAKKAAAKKPAAKKATTKKAAAKKPAAKKPAAKKTTAKKTTAKKATTKKAATKKPAAKKATKKKVSKKKGDGGSMLDAAFQILETAGKPLHYKDITKEALSKSLINTTGATPEQSMRSAISREITSKGAGARFKRDPKKKGFYRLTYWDRES